MKPSRIPLSDWLLIARELSGAVFIIAAAWWFAAGSFAITGSN